MCLTEHEKAGKPIHRRLAGKNLQLKVREIFCTGCAEDAPTGRAAMYAGQGRKPLTVSAQNLHTQTVSVSWSTC